MPAVHVGVAWDCRLLDDCQCGLPPARKIAMHPRERASLEAGGGPQKILLILSIEKKESVGGSRRGR